MKEDFRKEGQAGLFLSQFATATLYFNFILLEKAAAKKKGQPRQAWANIYLAQHVCPLTLVSKSVDALCQMERQIRSTQSESWWSRRKIVYLCCQHHFSSGWKSKKPPAAMLWLRVYVFCSSPDNWRSLQVALHTLQPLPVHTSLWGEKGGARFFSLGHFSSRMQFELLKLS